MLSMMFPRREHKVSEQCKQTRNSEKQKTRVDFGNRNNKVRVTLVVEYSFFFFFFQRFTRFETCQYNELSVLLFRKVKNNDRLKS